MSRDTPRRPLADLIHDHNLDVSDEEDGFFVKEEGDFYLQSKWRAMLAKASTRIPRRLQRYFVIYAIGAIILLISYWVYLGPTYNAYKKEQAGMTKASKMKHVKSVTPEFKDMVQLKDLDQKYLPSADGRLVVVGDVHGCKEELEQLLKEVGFKEDKDHLVLTGDIVAKGPDSPGVVDLASRLGASCVRGNHEDRVLLTLSESDYYNKNASGAGVISRSPEKQDLAGLKTESELVTLSKSFNDAQLSYLKSCPVILRVGQIGTLHNVVVVHAGLVPDLALEEQDPFQVMNMRTIDLATLLPSMTRKHTPWEKYWNHQEENKPEDKQTTVIYGHDRKRGKNILKHSMGLDSGCVAGGSLTAMVIEEGGKHEYVEVACKGYVD